MQKDRTLSWTGLEELRPMLAAYATRRCRDQTEADDIVQETLLRAARYRPNLEDPDRLGGWALRIAANVHRDSMRREGRYVRPEQQEEWLHSIASEDDAEETCGAVAENYRLGELDVELDEALHHLPAAIGDLRAVDREVLLHFYKGNESCLDLARRFQISRGLAKVRVYRARKRLTRMLRRRLTLHGRRLSVVLAS